MSLPLLSRDMWLARELAVVGAEPSPLIADEFFFLLWLWLVGFRHCIEFHVRVPCL